MASTINASTTLGLISTADTSGVLQLQTANTTAVTVSATQNVGLGTASPTKKLDILSNTSQDGIRISGSANPRLTIIDTTTPVQFDALCTDTEAVLRTDTNHPLVFSTNGTERMRLDSAGNLGLGVTPSAWGSGSTAFQLGNGAIWKSGSRSVDWIANGYYNGTNYIYNQTAAATYYRQYDGQHLFFNAASGTAGNAISFTQAMTLDADGDLGIGTTSPSSYAGKTFQVNSSSTSVGIKLTNSATGEGNSAGFDFELSSSDINYVNRTASGNQKFWTNSTERARIDSSGNLLVGTTSQFLSEKLSVITGNTVGVGVKTTGGASNATVGCWNATTSGDSNFIFFATETSITVRGSIDYNRAGGLTRYNTTSDYRAKDISGPVTNSGALIDSVPVYMGKMKWATEERPMFIAHEVPAYAHTGTKDEVDADGKPVYQQMDASALIPVMWAEIQSLRQRLSAANL